MEPDLFGGLIWLAVSLVVGVLFLRHRRRRRSVGSAGAGTVYDWLNQDAQRAVEIVAEGQAEATDPETRDGNLPDLEKPE